MTDVLTAPYGTWKSPINPDLVANSPHGWIGHLWVERDQLYVLRNYPDQGGRGVVARMDDAGNIENITPPPFYARTRVYEYGGACYAVHEGVIYFSNFPDDRIYRQVPGQQPVPITAEGPVRYADLAIDPKRHRLICIREDHRVQGEPQHTITAVALDGNGEDFGTALFDSADFVAFPVISSSGDKIAWVGWNHPNMPFYSSSLWAADVQPDGSLVSVQQVVPELEESITDPCWSPEGVLYYCTDRNNWWNLHRWKEGQIEHVFDYPAELGNPFWNIGLRMYRFLSEEKVIAAHNELGTWQLVLINTQTGEHQTIPTPFTFIARLELMDDKLYMVAASPNLPRTLARVDLGDGSVNMMDHSVKYDISDEFISVGQQIEYPTARGLSAYAFYHAPKNPKYQAPEGELPPVIVEVHGGPTGSTKYALDMGVQYYTSRGFAVLSVNYGGSAGYGREYRDRLRGQWGVVDVEDAVNGVKYLVRQGLADPKRTIIRGGSAGGFTTFAALAFTDTFKSGSSLFGISDVEVFHKETHKYESHYCETLVGPYPEQRDLYYERSAISKADKIQVPLIIFQGAEDKIVPRNQSIFVRDALIKQGIPVYYVEFEGEGHGFRRYESVVRVLEDELSFWGKVFDFIPAGNLPDLLVPGL